MCTGIEILAVGSLIGGAVSAGAAIHQGQVQKNYANYQADQAEADAKAAQGAAQVEAERIRKAGTRQRAEAVAALAGSGMDVNSSTALRIDQTITQNSEDDAFMTLTGANNQALRLNAAAGGYRQQGSQALSAGYVGAATNLLQASTRAGYGWKQPTPTGA